MHELLSEKQLSSAPLVRFTNGHVYQFIHGHVCSETDIANPTIWRGVAKEIARWHAMLPVVSPKCPQESFNIEPSIWSTAKKWLDALPDNPQHSTANKNKLREEFQYLTNRLLFRDSDPDPLV